MHSDHVHWQGHSPPHSEALASHLDRGTRGEAGQQRHQALCSSSLEGRVVGGQSLGCGEARPRSGQSSGPSPGTGVNFEPFSVAIINLLGLCKLCTQVCITLESFKVTTPQSTCQRLTKRLLYSFTLKDADSRIASEYFVNLARCTPLSEAWCYPRNTPTKALVSRPSHDRKPACGKQLPGASTPAGSAAT